LVLALAVKYRMKRVIGVCCKRIRNAWPSSSLEEWDARDKKISEMHQTWDPAKGYVNDHIIEPVKRHPVMPYASSLIIGRLARCILRAVTDPRSTRR